MCNALAIQEERSYNKMMMAFPALWQVQISVGRVYTWNLDKYWSWYQRSTVKIENVP
jgi:hypothetical protein